ncbi:MAG: hypothetical protein F4Z57_14440 [Gemmatimonadetes bacterium]|nr:hypothetical protein [Gemmatimonadota bacterium]MYC69714.1 hypothetical protein [Gemmatimonadota bacterium]MYI63602.1 hypothetical protein [Gemmatimonadota bacterium]
MRPPAARVFTPKALILGCLFTFFVAAGDSYGVFYLRGSYMTLGTSTVGALFLLFFLAGLINPLLKLVHPRAGLNRGELLLIYIMMVMASPLPVFFAARFIGTILTPFYYATPENDWHTLIQPHIADWLQPRDLAVMWPFYEGLEQGQSIPWAGWLPMFLRWAPLVWALFLAMIAAMAILRKQWNDYERLTYPLVQVPMALTEQDAGGDRIAPFFKNPVMWTGFAVPAIWGTLHGLHNYFPETVPIATNVDPIHFILPIFDNLSELQFKFRFNILGFFYFLKTEIAFSLWFFNLFANALRTTFAVLGVTSSEMLGGGHSIIDPILVHQSMGGMLVLFLFGLFAARKHLWAVCRKALWGDSTVDDSGEILSYRTAVLILLGSSAVMVAWLALAGLPVWVVLAFLFITFALFVGFTRLIAEGGLSDGSVPVGPAAIVVSAVGSSAIGAQGMVVLATTFFWTNGRSFAMTSAANSLKLGEGFGGSKRPLFWTMLLAMAVGMVSSMWVVMELGYSYGALNLKIPGGKHGFYDYAAGLIRTPSEPHLWGWINTGIGAGVMLLLMLARWYYVWWPLHPLGYPIGPTGIMDHLWFDMFLAWLIKVSVLRYGGVALYRKTRPFFMGMIAGHIVPGGLFLFVDHFTGMVGNVIFWG